MKKYQIFVSSTYDDLREERDSVIKAILEMGHIPVGMEMFSAADEEQWKLIARQIQGSDYHVVVVAHRYGSTIHGVSYTEKEYDFAITQDIPVLGFVIAESASWPNSRVEVSAVSQVRRFKAKIQQRHVAFWASANDLYGKVAISLMKQFAVTPRPGWVRATESIDPSVINELSRLSEENRHLRDELDRIRTVGQSVQIPELGQLIRLSLTVYLYSNGVLAAEREESAEVSWLDLLRAVGPDLVTGAMSEDAVAQIIIELALRLEESDERNYRIHTKSLDALRVELMAQGLIETERIDDEVYWRLTSQGRAFLLSKRDLLLEQAAEVLRPQRASLNPPD